MHTKQFLSAAKNKYNKKIYVNCMTQNKRNDFYVVSGIQVSEKYYFTSPFIIIVLLIFIVKSDIGKSA